MYFDCDISFFLKLRKGSILENDIHTFVFLSGNIDYEYTHWEETPKGYNVIITLKKLRYPTVMPYSSIARNAILEFVEKAANYLEYDKETILKRIYSEKAVLFYPDGPGNYDKVRIIRDLSLNSGNYKTKIPIYY